MVKVSWTDQSNSITAGQPTPLGGNTISQTMHRIAIADQQLRAPCSEVEIALCVRHAEMLEVGNGI